MNKFIFAFGLSFLSLIANQAVKATLPNEDDNNDTAPHSITVNQAPQNQTEKWVPGAPFKPNLLQKMQEIANQSPNKFRVVGSNLWINMSAS